MPRSRSSLTPPDRPLPQDRETIRALPLKTRLRLASMPMLARVQPGLASFAERVTRWTVEQDRVDRSIPLPGGAEEELRYDNPRLLELRTAYDALDWPVVTHSRWRREGIESWLDLAWFRGETAYVHQYRDLPQLTPYRYFVYLQYLESGDGARLFDVLDEDGLFGCFSFEFPGHKRCSRDLLDSVNELLFLDEQLGFLGSDGARVLDIGAGYGRLAHRGLVANPKVQEWTCVDAVAPSTFLCEWYLRFRGATPPARVVPLYDVPALVGPYDFACNVHSFSECTLDAIRWWVDQLVRLEVPTLFLVPNEEEGFLSTERDGRRLDFLPVLEAAGFQLEVDRPAISDPAVRELFGVHDRHTLFRRG